MKSYLEQSPPFAPDQAFVVQSGADRQGAWPPWRRMASPSSGAGHATAARERVPMEEPGRAPGAMLAQSLCGGRERVPSGAPTASLAVRCMRACTVERERGGQPFPCG